MEYSVFEALDMFNGTIHKSIDMSHGNINMNNFTGEILFLIEQNIMRLSLRRVSNGNLGIIHA